MPRLTHVRSMPATLARVTPAIAVNASDPQSACGLTKLGAGMLSFAWRRAHVGGAVVVHDVGGLDEELLVGVVAFGERRTRATRLRIRVAENRVERVFRPFRPAVHWDSLKSLEHGPALTVCLPPRFDASREFHV